MFPQNTESWTQPGVHWVQKGNRLDAEKALLKALEIKPKDRLALTNLGNLDIKNEHLTNAISLLNQAHKRDPESVVALSNPGGAYTRAGEPWKAI